MFGKKYKSTDAKTIKEREQYICSEKHKKTKRAEKLEKGTDYML